MPATERPPALVMVLLDALRHDAPGEWHAALDADGVGLLTGAVRENFGFQTRPAYFAGLDPETSGLVTMMVHAPGASPFRSLRAVPRPLLRLLDRWPRLSHIVRGRLTESLRRRHDAVALYGSTLDIPLDLLPEFDFAEKALPWEGYAGRPSLFSLLAERDEEYAYVGYPFVTTYGSDADSVRTFCERVGPATRFAFLQLNDLDGIGHRCGPDGMEYARGVEAYARHLEVVVAHCRMQFGEDFGVIAFGDHGMVAVTAVLDVVALLSDLPRALRRSLTYFVDSTLLRVWASDPVALAAVHDRLSGVSGGRVLDDAARTRYRIRFPDQRLGQLVFMAEPGTVFHPNWFGRTGTPVRGMHGYDPDHRDNLGALAVASPRLESAALGTVAQADLFPTALDMLGLPVPGRDTARSLARQYRRSAPR